MQTEQIDLSAFPPTRAEILRVVKDRGSASLAELAAALGRSRENTRQQVRELAGAGWLQVESRSADGRGRPAARYALTTAGEHLFPKHYDSLVLTLLDAVERRHGNAALRQAMADLTDAEVAGWEKRLAHMNLAERIEALRGIYFEDDPYTETDVTNGEFRLIEKNCPYLNVAMRQPLMCSITVSTLTRLLGHKVVREKKFQEGDHRCVFRVLRGRPVDPKRFSFEFESEPASGSGTG